MLSRVRQLYLADHKSISQCARHLEFGVYARVPAHHGHQVGGSSSSSADPVSRQGDVVANSAQCMADQGRIRRVLAGMRCPCIVAVHVQGDGSRNEYVDSGNGLGKTKVRKVDDGLYVAQWRRKLLTGPSSWLLALVTFPSSEWLRVVISAGLDLTTEVGIWKEALENHNSN